MKIRYDDNLESYRGFFDAKWSEKLLKKIKSTFLDEIVFELCASWKGTSSARSLPWLMVESMKQSLIGFSKVKKPIPLEVIEILIERIAKNMEKHKTTLLIQDKQALKKEIENIHEELLKANQEFSNHFNKEQIWDELIKAKDFVISLWMSEVNAYAAVYFAYEIFLINCLKKKYSLESLRTTNKKFDDHLKKLVGEKVYNECWAEKFIEKARLIRHALVHNGRKITKDLEKYRNELTTEESEIVIFPHNTTTLFDELKNRVNSFCNKIISHN